MNKILLLSFFLFPSHILEYKLKSDTNRIFVINTKLSLLYTDRRHIHTKRPIHYTLTAFICVYSTKWIQTLLVHGRAHFFSICLFCFVDCDSDSYIAGAKRNDFFPDGSIPHARQMASLTWIYL